LEVGQLPHKTIYLAGIDTELNMDGCTILVHMRRQDTHEISFEDESRAIAKHEIDFSTPGEYEVFFYWGIHEFRRFDTIIIQVVSPD